MLTDVELIRKRKKELGWTNQIRSERSGVPLGTVNKILSGTTVYPRPENLVLLRRALELHVEDTGYLNPSDTDGDHVSESTAYYASRDSRKTTDDYYELPKDIRVDPIKMRVVLYSFWKDNLPELYSFEDVIPSRYYPDLVVDMKQVKS